MTDSLSPGETVELLHLTDTHVMADPHERLQGVDTSATLERVISQVVADGIDPAAVLVTGDIAGDDSAGAYARFRDVLARLARPVYGIPGNHDDPGLLRRWLPATGFHVAPLVDVGPWRVVLLDSVVPGEVHGELAAPELERLDAALGEVPGGHALVCLHHPPVRLGSAWMDRIGLANAADLWEVLGRHATVRGVLWGHAHQVYDSRAGAVRLLGTPSTCLQFLPGSDEPAYDDLPPGYRVLALHPDGTLDTRVAWVPDRAGGPA